MAELANGEIHPGQELRRLLREMYPPQAEQLSTIARLDAALMADGEFHQLVYESSINYMLRRLVTTATYLRRRVDSAGLPESRFIYNLRTFLSNELSLPTNRVEILLALLMACTQVSKRTPTRKTLRRARRSEREAAGALCYICGGDLDHTQGNLHNSAMIDHLWPRSLGGPNEGDNLRLACRQCSEKKGNFLDASDFHYEQISLVSDKGDEHFSAEMRRTYEIALWSKNEFKCMRCGKPASVLGRLEFGRRNLD